MNNIRVLLLLLALLGIFVIGQKSFINLSEEEKEKRETVDAKKEVSKIPTPKQETLKETVPIPTPSPAPTQHQEIGSLQYPNAVVNSLGTNSLQLETTDDPKVVTNWYKDRIRNMGMATKTFVQTNTNGNILNKLIASNARSEITVEITRQFGQFAAKISVTTK